MSSLINASIPTSHGEAGLRSTNRSGSGFVPPLYITSILSNTVTKSKVPSETPNTVKTAPSDRCLKLEPCLESQAFVTPVIPSGVQLVTRMDNSRIFSQALSTPTITTMSLSTSSMTPIPLSISDSGSTVDGRYQCPLCDRAFKQPHQLTLHKNIHYISKKKHVEPVEVDDGSGADGVDSAGGTAARPFRCSYCNVGFRLSGHLMKHLRSQTHFQALENQELIPKHAYDLLAKKLHSLDVKSDDLCLASINKLLQEIEGELFVAM